MTHNGIHDKTNTQVISQANRQDFLRALYTSAPDNLHLELRCIHPITAEVRTLWGRMSDKRGLGSALKQADKLNAEGFGLYFAPCLRKEKKGNTDSAAWLPALWIDIDTPGNEALARLKAFDPAPNFIIDSGGGWHGYWLLDTPFLLETDADKQKIAAILRGLFSALGGDPGYVKSVASVMRLPDSTNTKPERGNIAGIVHAGNDRYPLERFAWLEVQPGAAENGTSPNGKHPLPPRTESYLASGATNGNRNAELFAAACQLRDAGYSQNDAERELVARHVADGGSNENTASREKEARATIVSAYKQPPREPIQTAKERVSALVGRASERPDMGQIREVVKACAALDPLDWAEQRQKLRAVCGEGVKLSDLDRLHREEKKALARQKAAAFVESESYLEADGKMIYRRMTERGTFDRVVADWTGCIVESVSRVDDDGEHEQMTVIELRQAEQVQRVSIPAEVFGDDAALRRLLAGRAGVQFTVRAGMGKHLTPAILSLSPGYVRRMSYRFMGWTQINGRWTYLTPGAVSDALYNEDCEVELEPRLRDYGLQAASWSDSLAAFRAMIAVFPAELAPALISFALLPLFQRFFPAAAHKPALHLVGTTGSGKSEIAALMTSLYGSFSRDTPPAQWGDTINTVEILGNALADALYWVDDYKAIYADEKTFTRFLQSYSRGMGRGRLTREAKLRVDRPCRGHILSTGETSLEGEASVAARMMSLEIPPWEQRDPQGQALKQAERLRGFLPGFTLQLARWIAGQAYLTESIATRYAACVEYHRDRLAGAGMRLNNINRIVGNWAVMTVVYQLVGDFLRENGADDALPAWRDVALRTAQALQEERAAYIVLDVIGQLLAGGQVVIDDLRSPSAPVPGVTTVGYRDSQYVYFLPDILCQAVNRVQTLRFTPSAIGAQLKEEGWLVAGNSAHHLTVQVRVKGSRVRVWRVRRETLYGDSGDGGDTD